MDLNERKHYDLDGDWRWFTEFAGVGMAHNFYVHHLFSRVCSSYEFGQIVELGTYWGAMTTVLALEAMRQQIPFYTLELAEQRSPATVRLHKALGVVAEIADVFAERDKVKAQLRQGATFLVCDNGHKGDEFFEFVPVLPPGSVVAVHDYGTEFYDRDWERRAEFVTPLWPEEWTAHNCQLCLFTRNQTPEPWTSAIPA